MKSGRPISSESSYNVRGMSIKSVFLYLLHISLSLSVLSVSELEFSAVDQRASPGPSTDCATLPDPLKQPLNSTRSPSADRTSAGSTRRAQTATVGWLDFYAFRCK